MSAPKLGGLSRPVGTCSPLAILRFVINSSFDIRISPAAPARSVYPPWRANAFGVVVTSAVASAVSAEFFIDIKAVKRWNALSSTRCLIKCGSAA
jgi:hypothetical protein